MRICWLLLYCAVLIGNTTAQWQEPYQLLHGGSYAGPVVKSSPDPLVNYRWNRPLAADSLQLYNMFPQKITGVPAGLFTQQPNQIMVNGKVDMLFDFGVESAGWLEFESEDMSGSIEASISEYNEPAIVNRGAQHPVKTSVPEKMGNTYRLRLNDGLYEGVRFAWIHVHTFAKAWHIKNLRLVCQVKPVNYLGSFSCNDSMLNRIWYTGAYVVKLNMLQDYFGAILMERSDRHSWTGDAYPAQAAALAAFGNYDVIKKNIAFTSGQNNGIAAYSMYWVLSLTDYYNYTGDTAFLKAYAGNAGKRLQQAFEEYDSLPSLGFMGWDERLGAGFEEPQAAEAQLTYRLLCINAWKQFSKAMLSINENTLAEKYWQYAQTKTLQLKTGSSIKHQFGIHAISEAVNAGLSADQDIAQLAKKLFSDRLNRLSYSPFNQYFILQAMGLAQQYDAAITTVKDCWGGQVSYGGTCFFEVYRPSWNTILHRNDAPPNNQCGYTSLAHPWGAGVTKWLSENILGIQPLAPGFKKFNIIPHLQDNLTQVKGIMPTVFGPIAAAFNTETGTGEISVPKGTVAEMIGFSKAGRKVKSIFVNNKLYNTGFKEDSSFIYLLQTKPGKYHIRVNFTGVKNIRKPVTEKWMYPINNFRQDSHTSGNWMGRYGKEGFVFLGREGERGSIKLPSYIEAVHVKRNGTVVWDSASADSRVLESAGNDSKVAAAIITKDPEATLQTMTIDVSLKENHPFQLSLYFLDWDKKDRRSAIEIFDLSSLNIIAPVQLVDHYEQGKYISFSFDRPVRIRINQVRGKNAALSGIFFDSQ